MVIPIKSQRFALNKGEFRGVLNIRYFRHIKDCHALTFPCAVPFTVQHTIDCEKGDFVSIRHTMKFAMSKQPCYQRSATMFLLNPY